MYIQQNQRTIKRCLLQLHYKIPDYINTAHANSAASPHIYQCGSRRRHSAEEYCRVHWHCQDLHATLATAQCIQRGEERRKGEREGEKEGRKESKRSRELKVWNVRALCLASKPSGCTIAIYRLHMFNIIWHTTQPLGPVEQHYCVRKITQQTNQKLINVPLISMKTFTYTHAHRTMHLNILHCRCVPKNITHSHI